MERMVLTKEDKTIRQILIDVASKGSTITYTSLCSRAGLELDMHNRQHASLLGDIIGDISTYEVEHGRPMLSSVVLTKNGYEGNGFFRLAEELFNFTINKQDEKVFQNEMIKKTHKYWETHKDETD